MPPYKSPSTLYVCACKKLNDILDVICHNIWQSHWAYMHDTNSIPVIVADVQNFLTTSIPVSVLDEVINLKKSGKFLSECSAVTIKILLSLVMHPHMRIFKISKLDIPNSLTSRIEESFWVTHLSRMSNLVFLDLSLICTDEILKIVGKYCTQLEAVTVISKMSRIRKGGNFNALRKVYHVSDLGLSYLAQCQKLKCVTINRSNRSGIGNMTEKGICTLTCSLPNLKSINYELMGAVLSHIPLTSSPLKLQYLKDLRVNPAHIALYNILCPSLVSLHISLPTNLCQQDIITQSELIEEAISNSSLMLRSLKQNFLHVSNRVYETLLAKKGTNLVCINFGSGCGNFDVETLRLIGHYCPNVEELTINTMGPDADTVTLPKQKSSMFQQLRILSLGGESAWNAKHALSLCLQGYKISDLYVCGARQHLDDVFTHLIRHKKFLEMKDLFLHRHCYISSATVWQILQECPKINTFYCIFDNTFTVEELESFKKFIGDNNYDLNLIFSGRN